MAGKYLETPRNWKEIEGYVNKGKFAKEIFERKKCFFYDACSFRYHANLKKEASEKIFEYFKKEDGMVVLTRTILMELGSVNGKLHENYIRYVYQLDSAKVPVYVVYEEELFEVMGACFSANEMINSMLSWAVRMSRRPVSTIWKTLENNRKLSEEIIDGKNHKEKGLYERFFASVRANKEHLDDLGEELLAICIHILSRLPGEEDGKFCILTDDKGAAGKIDALFQKTNRQYQGKKIILFSTPKLAQVLFSEGILKDKEVLTALLSACGAGKVKVLGMEIYDLKGHEIVLDREELAGKIFDRKIYIII